MLLRGFKGMKRGLWPVVQQTIQLVVFPSLRGLDKEFILGPEECCILSPPSLAFDSCSLRVSEPLQCAGCSCRQGTPTERKRSNNH